MFRLLQVNKKLALAIICIGLFGASYSQAAVTLTDLQAKLILCGANDVGGRLNDVNHPTCKNSLPHILQFPSIETYDALVKRVKKLLTDAVGTTPLNWTDGDDGFISLVVDSADEPWPEAVDIDGFQIGIKADKVTQEVVDFYPVSGYYPAVVVPFSARAAYTPSAIMGSTRMYYDVQNTEDEAIWRYADGSRLSRKTHPATDLVVNIYDAGPGNCVVIECPGATPRKAMILDCGSIQSTRLSSNGLPQVFQTDAPDFFEDIFETIDRVQTVDLLLTHPDRDHINVIETALRSRRGPHYSNGVFSFGDLQNPIASKLQNMYIGGHWDHYQGRGGTNAGLQQFLSGLIETSNLNRSPIRFYLEDYNGAANDPIRVEVGRKRGRNDSVSTHSGSEFFRDITQPLSCGDAKVNVLAVNNRPDQFKTKSFANNQSIVVSVEYRGRKILLTGDATQEGLRQAASHISAQNVDVLLVPHHGSEALTHFPQEWLDVVHPRSLIYSAGGSFGHPREESYNAYNNEQAIAGPVEDHVITFNGSVSQTLDTQTMSTYDDGDIKVSVNDQGGVNQYCIGPWGREFTHQTPIVRWCNPLAR
jgi:beta-lactamase superfamily II metal-dependent hydrolase